ncbi:PLP-dependent aminotransferase family protein [Puia sp.]|jgi:(S)-3,5-dihydroxyphenylglycine transaminase|uniref:aminotransferase-like domain-containing protein n=1 Tax=Puia sp. TaxID=2045100 RepID=UPI002F40D042
MDKIIYAKQPVVTHPGTMENYLLNTQLGKGYNNVIGFLNDVQYRFPGAISFAAGQPDETFFDLEEQIKKIDVFAGYLMKKTGKTRAAAFNAIGQYNKTKGIVNEIIREYLIKDVDIDVPEESILLTVGAQEAFAVVVTTLCNRETDVVLTEDPGFIGLSSFAKAFGFELAGVPVDKDGLVLEELENVLDRIGAARKKAKVLYVIPDYQNPTGACMPVENRLELIRLAEKHNFLIVEDSVYNSFGYSTVKNPTLKALDSRGRVIYIGSFSKSLFPGLRIGLIVADQRIRTASGDSVSLADEMAKVKGLLSLNTPTINQAILAGILLDLDCTLKDFNAAKVSRYREKRDQMVMAIDQNIMAYRSDWSRDIRWNIPEGGFFVKMQIPFIIDNASVVECASRFGIIICPMRYFHLEAGGEYEIRLAFSNLSTADILVGIKQLAAYLKERIKKSNYHE